MYGALHIYLNKKRNGGENVDSSNEANKDGGLVRFAVSKDTKADLTQVRHYYLDAQ